MNYHLFSRSGSSLCGEIEVPGDKSISHRSIIFGSLAEGTTIVHGFLDGEDCLATMRAFQSMGVTIEGPSQQKLMIHGVGKYGLKQPKGPLDCGNSGTSMRLLAGLLAAQTFDSALIGDASLSKRPMLRISKPLTLMGADIETTDGKPPIQLKKVNALAGIDYTLPEVSAQVKSCLLLAGMYAQGKTIVRETGISRDHTERMLKTFSYPYNINEQAIEIDASGRCVATELYVPGDISSAAFFMVAASIIPNSELLIKGVGYNPTRTGIIDILLLMGANIEIVNQRMYGAEPVADILVRYAPLRGIAIPESLVPLAIDEFPIIFIAAAAAQGITTISGARELRLKESDRIGTMVEGLKQIGIKCIDTPDGATIEGGRIQGGVVESHLDHRIAMSFTVAGMISKNGIEVKNCEHIATSYPTFISTAQNLNCSIEVI